MDMEKIFDLELRTLAFAKAVMRLCKKLPKDVINLELGKQIVRSSGSVGANYREANEALGKKDFKHRIGIARKECKETSYWLELIKENNPHHDSEVRELYRESMELRNILSAILSKSE